MSEPIIRVEDISKKYIISHQQQAAYSSLRDDLVRLAKLPKELFTGREQTHEELWALKDVSFEVQQGDVVGIIGRNGSGKSTLLKVLSRIVEPTEGKVTMKGRVASLLEVGTGFHPELSGRENIYLNGAVLGMSKREIKRKFDEIVAFSEVEKFLDTPVKFYSSGMYVRLAFSIAAHLEPDILIVDEVLAVGDIEFQRKSLGKMEEVTKEGRTVLFVSHNMGSVRSLCNTGILLTNGEVEKTGKINEVVDAYMNAGGRREGEALFESRSPIHISSVAIKTSSSKKPKATVSYREPFSVEIEVKAAEASHAVLGITLTDSMGEVVTTLHTQEPRELENDEIRKLTSLKKGQNLFSFNFNPNELRPARYYLTTSVFDRKLNKNYDHIDQAISFEVVNDGALESFEDGLAGIFFPRVERKKLV
jgi:lipopolysaccharide transport system ATP-binding protein